MPRRPPPLTSNQKVAASVLRLRRQQRWSQEKLAANCGLHRTYVGAVERGEHNITLDTLDQLAQGLGVEPLELLRVHAVRRAGG